MKAVLNRKKDDVLHKIITDINSNNRYIGEGCKIAGIINDEKMYLNIEDRRGKSSKFMNEVFYGKVYTHDDKTIITGKFRIDNYPLILFCILLIIAFETLVVSVIVDGINSDLFLPALIIIAVVIYFISLKRRSKITNHYIEKYINSIDSDT